MQTGKITATNKILDSLNIPDRFFKRMEVFIFGECNDGEQLYYYCGDCDDDITPYYIPAKWIIIK